MILMFCPYFDTLSEATGKNPIGAQAKKRDSSIECSRLVAFLCPISMNPAGFVQSFDRQWDKGKCAECYPAGTELHNYPIR